MRPDGLFIRTLRAPEHVVPDEVLGFRISSQAFRPSSTDNTVSGDLEQLLTDDGLAATALYPAIAERAVGAASLPVEVVRAATCDVSHLPVAANWYHGGITGLANDRKDKLKRSLARAASEIVPIDHAEAQRLLDAKVADARRRQASDMT